ncbi:helicase HerA-like domain-containing protein [Bacillus sp. SI2]|uniref:ATP-binding protein n=1 Tax=Bacillus sp. SI2 TaxID=3077323 RepID=UPI0028E6B57C|nr:helicase HerA-like domain-containing protein [Bacillus sp. SI2]WNV20005.1 helicase HerA-like domain-containing protein [Bacillus sp. SI2]
MDFRVRDLKFGTVQGVDGSQVIVRAEVLQKRIGGNPIHIEVGSFVNCGSEYHGDTICIVTRVHIEEVEKRNGDTQKNQIVELAIVGSLNIETRFTRGIDQLPYVGSEVYLITGEQMNHLLGIVESPQAETLPQKYFRVGRRSMRGAGDVYLDLDKFLGRHVAIVGTTGSGKSSTVAQIAQSILRYYPYPRIVFFDIHNEYPNAFSGEWGPKANCVSWNDFKLPYWFLDLDEFISIYYPDAGGTQKMHLKDMIEELKRNSVEGAGVQERVSVDSPIYFSIEELITKIEGRRNEQNSASKREPFDKMLLKIQSKHGDSRFEFLKGNPANILTLEQYFISLLGLNPSGPTYVSVLDLSGLPAEIRTVCVGILTRLFFDYKYWDMDPENLPLALVLEEAHTYIPEDNSSTYSLCLDRVEKVAKEGRKYGLSLIVVTQRPSNVSSTVLSQCGTFITLRLTNDLDQNKIKRLLPDSLGEQANVLSTLRDGEALVTGDAMVLPGKVRFDEPAPRPKSNDVQFHKSWTEGPPVGYDVKIITEAWNIREKRQVVGVEENEN